MTVRSLRTDGFVIIAPPGPHVGPWKAKRMLGSGPAGHQQTTLPVSTTSGHRNRRSRVLTVSTSTARPRTECAGLPALPIGVGLTRQSSVERRVGNRNLPPAR